MTPNLMKSSVMLSNIYTECIVFTMLYYTKKRKCFYFVMLFVVMLSYTKKTKSCEYGSMCSMTGARRRRSV